MNGDTGERATAARRTGDISLHPPSELGTMDHAPLIREPGRVPSVYGAESGDNCCYDRCTRTSCCGGKCRGFRVRKASDCLILAFSILSFLALFLGVVIPIAVDGLLNEGIYESFVVDSKGAAGYETWQKNNADGDQVVWYGVYYFDVQNPEGAINGEKPKVIERGPYMYREYFYKFDVEWSKGGELVSICRGFAVDVWICGFVRVLLFVLFFFFC